MEDGTRAVQLVHTHPGDVSFSPGDVALFSISPGLASQTLAMTDGAVYAMERGPLHDELQDWLAEDANRARVIASNAAFAVAHRLQLDPNNLKDMYFATHVANLALARLGLIRYTAQLPEDLQKRCEKRKVGSLLPSIVKELRREIQRVSKRELKELAEPDRLPRRTWREYFAAEAERPVLFAQVIDRLVLLVLEPADEKRDEQVQRNHPSSHVSCRPDSRTLRARVRVARFSTTTARTKVDIVSSAALVGAHGSSDAPRARTAGLAADLSTLVFFRAC